MFNIFNRNKIVSRKTAFNYGIPTELEFEIDCKKDGSMIVTSPELPGLITQVDNEKQFPSKVSEAILFYFDVPNKEGNLLHGDFMTKNIRFVSKEKKLQLV